MRMITSMVSVFVSMFVLAGASVSPVIIMAAEAHEAKRAASDKKPTLWEQVQDVEEELCVCRAEVVQLEDRFSAALTDAMTCQADKDRVDRKLSGLEVALAALAEKVECLESQNRSLRAENAKFRKELERLRPKK